MVPNGIIHQNFLHPFEQSSCKLLDHPNEAPALIGGEIPENCNVKAKIEPISIFSAIFAFLLIKIATTTVQTPTISAICVGLIICIVL